MDDKVQRAEEVAKAMLEAINDVIFTMPDAEEDRLPIALVSLSIAVGKIIVVATTPEGLEEVTRDFVHNLGAVINVARRIKGEEGSTTQ
jgi:hypothetical protein